MFWLRSGEKKIFFFFLRRKSEQNIFCLPLITNGWSPTMGKQGAVFLLEWFSSWEDQQKRGMQMHFLLI